MFKPIEFTRCTPFQSYLLHRGCTAHALAPPSTPHLAPSAPKLTARERGSQVHVAQARPAALGQAQLGLLDERLRLALLRLVGGC